MDQENIHENDINQQARDVENLPIVQDAFKAIENLRDTNFINNSERNVDSYSENNADTQSLEELNEENNQETLENEDNSDSLKEKKTNKYRKLQNDKYRALAEKEEALRRAAELEEMLKESLNSGTYHYSKNAYSELERAKENKRKAFEEGDFDAYLNADIALINSINAINELEKWANENEKPERNAGFNNIPQSHVRDDYSEVHAEIAKDWIDNHPYLQPNSKFYNPELASNVTNYINELDINLYRNNEAELIFSDEYFDAIDNYIASVNRPKRNNTGNIESFSNVSAVRNTSFSNPANQTNSPNRVLLTADEKLMADNAGISHKAWLTQKLKNSKSNVNRY